MWLGCGQPWASNATQGTEAFRPDRGRRGVPSGPGNGSGIVGGTLADTSLAGPVPIRQGGGPTHDDEAGGPPDRTYRPPALAGTPRPRLVPPAMAGTPRPWLVPPAMAGTMDTSSPDFRGVAGPWRNRMSSSFT